MTSLVLSEENFLFKVSNTSLNKLKKFAVFSEPLNPSLLHNLLNFNPFATDDIRT